MNKNVLITLTQRLFVCINYLMFLPLLHFLKLISPEDFLTHSGKCPFTNVTSPGRGISSGYSRGSELEQEARGRSLVWHFWVPHTRFFQNCGEQVYHTNGSHIFGFIKHIGPYNKRSTSLKQFFFPSCSRT